MAPSPSAIGGNPLDFIATYQARFKVPIRAGKLPAFLRRSGRLFRLRHRALRRKASLAGSGLRQTDEDRRCPDPLLLLQTEELAVVDSLAGKIYLIVYVDPATPDAHAKGGQRRPVLREIAGRLEEPAGDRPESTPQQADRGDPRLRQGDDYLAAVLKAKQYVIADGDMMQVQVGQRIRKPPIRRFAADAVSRAAFAESVALHVLLRFWRFSCGRRLAGNTGAPG